MSKGKLIVIEGTCDSVGKSTQYRLLIDRLQKEKNISVITHHFPSYGTYQGRPVEEYLKGSYGKVTELSPYFVNSLYAQDRAITWENGLKSEYEKGSIIILDRYTTSSLIYQSSPIEDKNERTKFINYIYDYEYHKMNLPEPDLVIFLNVPFDIAIKMKEKKGKKNIYSDDLYFMKKISDISIEIAQKYHWSFIECTQDDEMRSALNIHEEIYKLVKNILN